MILFPAIDVRDGRAVRLRQGDFARETVYDAPVEAARRWQAAGARYLHVVDLDGARTGTPRSLEHVEQIAALGLPVQVGGGLRTVPDVRAAFRAGATRVILGTAAYVDVDFLDDVVARWGERLLVSVDVRGGKVATAGWTEQTQMPAEGVIVRLQGRGVRSFVYSDIERDGMLEGPDLEGVRRIARTVRGRFLYSGGVGDLEDLRKLAALRQVNLAGVIVGRALYEGRFGVGEANAILEEGTVGVAPEVL
jgi:phosphoribosylformimino-5-aminoimidazole carboxamide ribotide isomerase